MNVLIKSATILDDKSDFHYQTQDILVENGFITQIAKSLKNPKKYPVIELNVIIFIYLKVGLIAVYRLESQGMRNVKQLQMDYK